MSKIHRIPLFLFGILVLKSLVFGSTWTDAAIISICGVIGFLFELRFRDKKVEDLEQILNKQNETILALAKAVDETRTSVSSIKLAQGMRSTGNVGRI
jgi:predicted transcriptional regulator